MEDKALTMSEWHRKEAVTNFNAAWDLMDRKDRSNEEDILMIHTAHASRFHWGAIGTPLEFSRGEWQISRVYSVLVLPESALLHGLYCLDLCLSNDIGDFDLAFAHEAVARAQTLAGNQEEARKHHGLAVHAAEGIKSPEDRDYFLSELATIPLDASEGLPGKSAE